MENGSEIFRVEEIDLPLVCDESEEDLRGMIEFAKKCDQISCECYEFTIYIYNGTA